MDKKKINLDKRLKDIGIFLIGLHGQLEKLNKNLEKIIEIKKEKKNFWVIKNIVLNININKGGLNEYKVYNSGRER